jgi:hypothetical protein
LTTGNPSEYFLPESKPFGLSYGQWTVRWWQWLASIPANISPASDETGENAGVKQVEQNVWFLAGTFGGKETHRKCVMPSGRAILFPVINYQTNSLEKPELKTESELVRFVTEDEDDIINLEVSIDGQSVPIYRIRSDPTMFSLTAPQNNAVEIPGGGTTQATSDGYWVFLKPLSIGEHDIAFAGSCSAGSRNVKARYRLGIVEQWRDFSILV